MASEPGSPGGASDRQIREELTRPLPRRRRRLRMVLIVVGAFALVLLVLVALLPTIAGAVAPGYIERALNDSIKGRASVADASFSWFGSQDVGPITIADDAGQTVAQVNVRMSRGLLSLARGAIGGAMDIGTATISGTATIVRRPDGTTNVEDVFSGSRPSPPAPSGPQEPTRLPLISGSVVLAPLDVRFLDLTKAGSPAAAVRIADLKGGATIARSTRVDAEVAGTLAYGPDLDRASTPGGTLNLVASVDSLTDPSGLITPERASIDLQADVTDVATAIADTLAGMDNRLAAAVGERIRASIRAKGTLANAEASLAVTSDAVQADVALASTDGVLTTPRPGRISIRTDGLPALSPEVERALSEGRTATFDTLPEVTVTVDVDRIPLPVNGRSLDLRGSAFGLTIETTEASATVRLPGPGGEAGEPRPFRVAPLRAQLATQNLAERITLTAGTSATMDGQSAGTLSVNLAALDPLDASGRPRSGLPAALEGTASLRQVATAIAQPFAEAAGLDLVRDIGPTLDLELRARTAESANGNGGTLPPTQLVLDVNAANLTGAADLMVDQRTVRTQGEGVRLRINEVAALATRLLAETGVVVDRGGPASLTVANLAADLERLNRPGATGPDLRAVSADVRLETGPIAGRLVTDGSPARPWSLEPLTAAVDAADLTRGVALKARTAATLDGAQAGTLEADLRALGIVNPDGTPTTSLPAIDGRIALTNIATAIAQPFVEAAGLDLAAGVGPRLDLTLVASPAGQESAGAGTIPATDLTLQVRSAGLTSTLGLGIDGRTIRKRGEAAEITLRSPGALAARAARDAGIDVSTGGYLKVVARDFAIQLDENWSPLIGQSAAEIEVTTGGYSVALAPAPDQPRPAAPVDPLSLNQMIATVQLAPNQTPRVEARASGAHKGAAFFSQASLSLVGLLGRDAAGRAVLTPANLRPVGTVAINNLPTSLVSLVVPPPVTGDQAGAGLDLARLVREAVGPTVTANITSDAAGDSPEARDLALTLRGQNFGGGLRAQTSSEAISVGELDFRGQVTPGLAAALIESFGSGLASQPTLVSPATITISATPFTVPLAGAAPDLSRAGDATMRVGLEGRALVNNVVLASEDGPPRDLGTVGLENVLLTATVPLAALAEGAQARPATVTITGGVLGAPEQRILDLKGNATVPLAGSRPAGDLNAQMTLGVLDARWLDKFLGKPGLLAGGVGDTASVEATARVQFPAPAAAPAASAFERATLSATISAPRVVTAQPLRATLLPDRLTTEAPMVLRWTVDPEWANAQFLTRGNEASGAPPARFESPVEVTLNLAKLTVAMGEGAGLMKPGVFAADVQITAPTAAMLVGAGQQATRTPIRNLMARVTGGREPGTLGFNLQIEDVGGGRAPGGQPAVSFAGGIYNVADAAGNPTPDLARITANGDAVGVPTALIDAIANQRGLLVEALGPTVSATVRTQGFGESGGNLTADLTSARAEAHLKGSIRAGAFVTTEPAQVTLKTITPELGKDLIKGLPLIGTLEKRVEDGPAVLRATGLTLPLDGDLRKLNGQVVFDLGQARFQSSKVFGQILRIIGEERAATVGQRLEPFTVAVRDGVATYERFTVPLGEFSFATEGTVDLVNRRLDVVTLIPFGALSDEAANSLNAGLGRLLGGLPGVERATMVPFRTSGSFDQPETRPDMDLFARQLGRTLLRPDNSGGGPLRDLLDRLGRDRDR